MKQYPKTFENVFSSARSQRYFNITKVQIDGLDLVTYTQSFRDTMKKGMNDVFDFYVRVVWLKRKFGYTWQKKKRGPKGHIDDQAFSIFMRSFIGRDIRLLTRDFVFGKLESYMQEMFPLFDQENPFTNPERYRLPFKNISIDYMTVVYQLEDRMYILAFADECDMKYNDFLDFVINHTYSINQELKKDRYDFILTSKCPPYVRDNYKK